MNGESDDELPDIVAEVFVTDMEARLRYRPTAQYRDRADDLTRIRGRVDHLRTETARLLDRGRAACRFTELTIDTPRNQYFAAVLRKTALLVGRRNLAQRCAAAAFTLERLGVSRRIPTRVELSRESFDHSDHSDKNLLVLARLLDDMCIPEHEPGHVSMPELNTAAHESLRTLFEKSVRNYLRRKFQPSGWSVSGQQLSWTPGPKDTGTELLPRMHTDATLVNREANRHIVIEVKFTDALNRGTRKTSIKPGYLFQLYGYLVALTSTVPDARPAEGVLLFANTEGHEPISKHVTLHGHNIRFISLDLNKSPRSIRQTLDSCVEPAERSAM